MGLASHGDTLNVHNDVIEKITSLLLSCYYQNVSRTLEINKWMISNESIWRFNRYYVDMVLKNWIFWRHKGKSNYQWVHSESRRNPKESLEMFHPLIHEKNVTVNHIHVLEMSLQFRTKIPKESCESATGIPSELSIDYSWFIQLSFLLGKLMVLLPGNFGIQQRRYQRWSKVSRFLRKLVK